MQPDDRARILHMLEAADAAANFISGRTREDLERDLMLRFALVPAVEVFGEAATKVSASMKAESSGIPWLEIGGMRNRLVHAYFDNNPNILWKAATEEIPALVPRLRELLHEQP
jgi:uncharacterized protein with HEPN domain